MRAVWIWVKRFFFEFFREKRYWVNSFGKAMKVNQKKKSVNYLLD